MDDNDYEMAEMCDRMDMYHQDEKDELEKEHEMIVNSLRKQADKLVEALNHYTKHPIYWDKDDQGHLINEGPSQVAINAIKEYRGETNGES